MILSSAKITTIGFYNFLNREGDDLFKFLSLPDGIDKETLIDNILLRGGEFEVIYSDPFFYQKAIGSWSKKWERTIRKWIEGLAIEFAPLENYDRMEEWTDVNSGIVKGTENSTSESAIDSKTDNINKISAFNSDTLRNNDSSNANASSDSNSKTASDSTRTDNNTLKHTARIHGNIGVLTSTQMLEDYLRVEQWNLYEHVTDLFLAEFVIPIY